MMIAANIVLALAAVILLIGVIGEKDTRKQQNILLAFLSVLAFIIVINIIA